MIPNSGLSTRLIGVEKWLVMTIQTQSRVIVTAADVLHSCAVPSPIDAVLASLNQTFFFIKGRENFMGRVLNYVVQIILYCRR